MIPFEHIKTTEDRSWTLRLIQLLIDGDCPDYEKVVETLIELADDRTAPILTPIIFDTSILEKVRDAASRVVSEGFTNWDAVARKRWWQSGDAVLQRHAIRCAEAKDAEFIYTIASNPNGPFFKDAIQSLEYLRRDEERFLRLSSVALKDPDPQIRMYAAKNLMLQQPIFAEQNLIEATLDNNVEVAKAALDTLTFYSSRNAIRHLFVMQQTSDDVCNALIDSIRLDLREEIMYFLNQWANHPDALKYINKWLQPIKKDVLSMFRKLPPLEKTPDEDTEKPTEKIDCDRVISILEDQDSEWVQAIDFFENKVDWKSFNAASRERLIRYLLSHDDDVDTSSIFVSCIAFAAWQDTDNLLQITRHWRGDLIRKASYTLRFVPRSTAAAERLWEIISDANIRGDFAGEVLESFAHHCDPQKLTTILIDLAFKDERHKVRCTAIKLLFAYDSPRLKDLIPLLTVPSSINHLLHIDLLICLAEAKIEVPKSVLINLSEVDDVYLQILMAKQLGKIEHHADIYPGDAP